MTARGAGLFFTGFASGALFVAILLSVTALQPQSSDRRSQNRAPVELRPLAADRAQAKRGDGDTHEPVREPQSSHAIGLPLTGLRMSDLHDTFSQSRDGGRPHEAIDIMAPRGTPVYAVESGTIRKLFTSKAGGLTIYQFDREELYCYYYAHLDRYADGVAEGMNVKRGDLIGYVGSTGNASPAAPHLHFAIFLPGPAKRWWEGKAIDPYPVLMDAVR